VDRLRSADPNTRQLLLFLFVESIENADTKEVPSDLKGNGTYLSRNGASAAG